MGLLDDLMAPLREIVSIKNELTQNVTEVKETLVDAKDQLKQPLDDSAKPEDAPKAQDVQNDDTAR